MAQLADFASLGFAGAVDILGMTSALFFMPFAKTAAQVGTAVLQEVTESVASVGTSFADMLTKDTAAEEAKKIEEGVKEPGQGTSMLELIEQIQNGLQAKLQSMGLKLDGELTLSIDADGKVAIGGDPDSAAMLEQLINSEPKLQAKFGALKRACQASGESDQFAAKLRYEAGKVQLQVNKPVSESETQVAQPVSLT